MTENHSIESSPTNVERSTDLSLPKKTSKGLLFFIVKMIQNLLRSLNNLLFRVLHPYKWAIADVLPEKKNRWVKKKKKKKGS